MRHVSQVGTVLAVALPLPLVILDPAFSTAGVLLVLLLPLAAHGFAVGCDEMNAGGAPMVPTTTPGGRRP